MIAAVIQMENVPPWKKLGLKLKFAKESSYEKSARTNILDPQDGNEIVPEINGIGIDARPAKKRRLSPLVNDKSPLTLTSSFKGSDNIAVKKKVSFTAETKKLDGDSSRTLLAAQEARNQYIDDLYNENSEQIQADTEARSNAKAEGKRNSESAESSVGLKKSKDSLEYLSQFYEDKTTWKFNKNREIWILKHALSIEAIPESYEPALILYVKGLQSEGARSRLADQCREALLSEPAEDNMDNPSQRHSYHEEAEARHTEKSKQSLQDEERIIDGNVQLTIPQRPRLARARLLLHTLQSPTSTQTGTALSSNGTVSRSSISSSTNPSLAPTNNTTRLTRRKRKNRTVVNEVSSSEDGGSSSGSEDRDNLRRNFGNEAQRLKNSEIQSNSSSDMDNYTSSSEESSSDGSDVKITVRPPRSPPSVAFNSDLVKSTKSRSMISLANRSSSKLTEDTRESDTSSDGS